MKQISTTITLLLSGVVLLLTSCQKEEAQSPTTIQQIQKEQGIPVATMTLTPQTFMTIQRANGTVQGISQTYIANPAGGTLDNIAVSVGETVAKDAVIATMSFPTGSPVTAAKSNYTYAKKAYTRAQKLFKEGAVSQEQLEGIKTQYEQAKHLYNQAKAVVTIRAPFSGIVLEILQEPGTNIDEKTPIAKLADFSKLKVDMQINERQIHHYKKGQKAFITLGSDTTWGVISAVALSAYDLTHSFRVTALFDNKKESIYPGIFTNVDIITHQQDSTIVLPIPYVSVRSDGSHWIYVVHQGKAEKRELTLGRRNGTSYEIIDGLSLGDSVVIRGATLLQEGDNVHITTSKEQ